MNDNSGKRMYEECEVMCGLSDTYLLLAWRGFLSLRRILWFVYLTIAGDAVGWSVV
jgi:hypothetical protein